MGGSHYYLFWFKGVLPFLLEFFISSKYPITPPYFPFS